MQEGIYAAEMDREEISDKRSKRALMSKLVESILATCDKPKRPLIVVLATQLCGMLGVAIVLVRHAFRRPEAA